MDYGWRSAQVALAPLLSVQAEAETQVRVTSSSLQSEPKANFDRPEVSCHRQFCGRREGGSRVKENELMGALQTELMRPA